MAVAPRDLLAGRHVEIKGCRELRAIDVPLPVIDRFRARLRRTSTGCLMWTGAVNGDGYGIVRISRDRLVLAHRLAIALALGRCPADRVGDHFKCNTPGCVELEHLRLATLRGKHTRDLRPRVILQRIAGGSVSGDYLLALVQLEVGVPCSVCGRRIPAGAIAFFLTEGKVARIAHPKSACPA